MCHLHFLKIPRLLNKQQMPRFLEKSLPLNSGTLFYTKRGQKCRWRQGGGPAGNALLAHKPNHPTSHLAPRGGRRGLTSEKWPLTFMTILFLHMSIDPSIHPSISTFIYLYIYIYIYIFIYLSMCIYISVSSSLHAHICPLQIKYRCQEHSTVNVSTLFLWQDLLLNLLVIWTDWLASDLLSPTCLCLHSAWIISTYQSLWGFLWVHAGDWTEVFMCTRKRFPEWAISPAPGDIADGQVDATRFLLHHRLIFLF